MALITTESIDFYRESAPVMIRRRGEAYYEDGRVTLISFDGETAHFSVRGSAGDYTVTIRGQEGYVTASCSCPYAQKGRICKHTIASALFLRARLKTFMQRWDYRLRLALEQPIRKPRKTTRFQTTGPYALLYSLLIIHDEAYFIPYIIESYRWRAFPQEPMDPESFNRYLEENRSWPRAATLVSTELDPYRCVNLPPEAVEICNLLLDQDSPYYGYSASRMFRRFLTILARQNAPVFRQSQRGNFRHRVRLLDRPIKLEAVLMRSSEGLLLDVGARVGDDVFSMQKGTFHVISRDPAWALFGDILAPVANPEAMDIVPYLRQVTIPPEEESAFREEFFQRLAERVPVSGEVIETRDITAEPIPRLYLREEDGTFRATLVFAYEDWELEADPKAPAITISNEPGSWALIRVHRQKEREAHFYELLTDARYGLKRTGYEFGPATFELRARTHPLDFLAKCVPLLAQAGFEIYGHEELTSTRLKSAAPTVSVSISSGIDWFDIQAVVKYGDQAINLKEVLKALRKGERYIKLADGTFGQIPEEWMERFKHLFGLAEETKEGVRVRDTQLALLDPLLDMAAEVQAAREFQERRERLRSFDGITPQPVPQGFQGELRPYQKAGLDWLHFLHEYRLGGVLADDMGLGKTIQVLALLQSLKERGEADRASLLVVPKSLLVNWQREIARFTPGLSVLEFVGHGRTKEASAFDRYDIVITTYGTMLRDAEFLRSYRFHYVILDESQAIKNPVAKTARAARLLQADHRLAVTGTPVENTTFELWSQFAFVNPGLLGSMESFKETFATPIERNRDEQAAALLRKLVHPFILRRSKRQVAPELPPRTERLIYTELTPGQRRLYNRTRDQYRAELLGLIETHGLDDVRMLILKGLLRLRQICIHPTLVEPAYRGEAAKFELLMELLETLRAEGHKALIYSQFVHALKLVRRYLDDQEIPYAYLDGRTRDRHAQVDRFQNDPDVPFFLLSLKAGGVGLNLTAAEYVIHLDPWWNPAVEMQAADRAHRIGQEKPVFIYKLIARDTVEEKILQLQERKRDLVAQLVSTESAFFKALTREDVEILFS
ncbi:MAG: DEAD/DEAH box helicase [Anaerolineae bacterium]